MSIPAAHDLPDAVFVEDVAIVLDELAVMTRPGAVSRRDEGRDVEPVLASHRDIVRIEAPGTMDGGDVLRLGRRIFVGRSSRTSEDGITQLRALTSRFGYEVRAIAVKGCLHLKSAVCVVGEHTLIGNSAWVDRRSFPEADWIEIDKREPQAANALRIGDGVIYPRAFVHSAELLRRHLEASNASLDIVDASELAKAEGGVTCCSLIL